MGQQLAEGATIQDVAEALGERPLTIERALIRAGILDTNGGLVAKGQTVRTVERAPAAPPVLPVAANKSLLARLLINEDAMLRGLEIADVAERLNGPKEQRHLHAAIVRLAHARGGRGRRDALLDVAAISISLASECRTTSEA